MKKVLLSTLYLLLFFTIAGCGVGGDGMQTDFSGRQIRIVTTIGMIGDLVEHIGGERVRIESLFAAGVDPHLYKPTASDVKKLENADVVFYGGLELEGRMTDIFVKLARDKKPTFPVSEDIDPAILREPPEFQGKYDPHIWFDVELWQEAANKVEKELSRLDPESKALYRANLLEYVAELGDLHSYVQERVNEIPSDKRVLVTAHDAFGYFGRKYGMEVRGLQGISTESEASARDVDALAQYIADKKIKAIFVENTIPPERIQAVYEAVKSKGFDVAIGGQLFGDSMGAAGTPEGTYIGMLRHNVDTISNALK